MSRAAQWSVVAGVVALLAAGTALGARLGGAPAQVRVGAQAPAFQAATLDGSARIKTLEDYRGQVVLINLWATWCGPCVVEMPSIQRLYDRFRDAGLKVVAVAVDDPGYEQRILDFVREHQLTFEILHEGTGRIEATFQTQGIPATFLIGRDGRIRKLNLGAADWDSPANRAVVAQLLGVDSRAEPAPASAP